MPAPTITPTPIPIPRTRGGFGGFAPSRRLTTEVRGGYVKDRGVVAYPRQADVDQVTSGPRSPAPTATPRSTPPIVIDPSNAGIVNSSLSGNTLRGLPNDRYVSDRDRAQPAAERAEVAMIPSGGGRSPALIDDPNADWQGADQLADNGEPTVEVMQGDGRQSAPFWNRPPTPTYTPAGRDIAGFGGDMTIGQFLNTPLSVLRFGSGHYPTPVGRGTVLYADTQYSTPGAAPDAADIAVPTSEAEARGAAETAALKETGALNPDGTTGPTAFISPGPVTPRFGNLGSANGRRVYTTGNNVWRPVSGAPVDIRWDPNSGTGNFQASQFTKSWEAGGQDPGRPNDPAGTSDEGRTEFRNLSRTMGQMEDDRVVQVDRPQGPANQQSIDLYRAALRAVRMDPKTGYTAQYVQQLNDWIAAHQGTKGG